jgi:uncharacterized protein
MAIFLKANWENIVMANYEIDPKILQPYLPKGVELDLFEGKAYLFDFINITFAII